MKIEPKVLCPAKARLALNKLALITCVAAALKHWRYY